MASNKSRLIKLLSVASVIFCQSSLGVADDQINITSKQKLTGTLASTLVLTDNEALYGNSGGKLINQLILNETYAISDHVTLVGSLNINNEVHEQYESQIDYASANYNRTIQGIISTLRIGRVKYDIGLLETKRNNPASRYSIFLPFSSYFPAFNRYAQSLDGVQLDLTSTTKYGDITASYTTGTAILKEGDQNDIFFGYFHVPLNGTFTSPSPVESLTFKFQNPTWKFHRNITTVDVLYESPSYPGRKSVQVPLHHQLTTTGLRYDTDQSFVAMEYVEHDIVTKPVAWFIRGGINISEHTKLYAGYSTLFHKSDSPPPFKVSSPYDRTGVEYTVGLTHYYSSDIIWKLQYSRGKGTVWFSHPTTDPNWNILSVSLIYKFDLM